MNDPFLQHGAFSWSELLTDNVPAAIEYYSSVLGWQIEEMPMPTHTYYVVKAGDTPVGGIMQKPEGIGDVPNYWGCYITVDNVDETVAAAEAAGGKPLFPPMDIPTVGRMCAIADPTGAVVSVVTYEEKECHEAK